MSNYKWLLDAGHGGLAPDGKYIAAPGANMHVFSDGLTFYEGANNRAIVDILIPQLEYSGIDYEMVYDEFLDTPLAERVAAANTYYAEDKRCIYLSVHSDTMPEGRHGEGSGYGIYTWKGQRRTRIDKTRSEIIADCFLFSYGSLVDGFKFDLRKDFIQEDAREDFYVLRETKCPSVLIQNLFYDNRTEAEFLLSEDGQDKIASALLYGIMYVEEVSPI